MRGNPTAPTTHKAERLNKLTTLAAMAYLVVVEKTQAGTRKYTPGACTWVQVSAYTHGRSYDIVPINGAQLNAESGDFKCS